MGRRRYRRAVGRGGSRRTIAVLIAIVLIALAVFFGLIPTTSFSEAQANRGTSVEGAADPDALLQMDIADSVQNGQQSQLMVVTNPLMDRPIEVTATLDDGNDGTLSSPNDTDSNPDSVTFTLLPGDSETVDIEVGGSGPPPNTVTFDVAATAGDLSVTAPNRQTSVEGGPPSCQGPPWNRPPEC